MSYVRRNLADGESVLYEGQVYWVVFLRPAALALLAIFVLVAGQVLGVGDQWIVVMLAPWAP
ncbi:MAG: hypothetical protein EXQ97_08590 [Alphaproteobacteria bacterium]|nr:hypothetical protein [Alphaproteobacteria bacterium]